MPRAANWVISPVAPHSLTVRPLVVNDDMNITLCVDSRNHSYLLSLDGRSVMLDTDSQVVLRKAPFSIKVVKRLGHSFSATLRAKLMWGVDKREGPDFSIKQERHKLRFPGSFVAFSF